MTDPHQSHISDFPHIADPLSLGIDLSTQSITGALVDPKAGTVVDSRSISYVDDPRLCGCGIDHKTLLIPPRKEGEADQPPLLFLEALEALFSDMLRDGVEVGRIAVINISAQQHGHVYLNENFPAAVSSLATVSSNASGSSNNNSGNAGLAEGLRKTFAYKTAPIWMTSDTEDEASHIRAAVGGKERMIELSGSDSPLRFTGAVVRRVARRFPELYTETERIVLLNSFLAAVLCGRPDAVSDYGNSCGMSLMNYRDRHWDPELLEAVAGDIPGGAEGLEAKLPSLGEPFEPVGSVASYFQRHYGFSPHCLVAAGSGDNPQTKVLVPGDLLSLGTSFVNMVATDGSTVDANGYANAMYDGLGRPFMFGCRTNGALVWDRVRDMHGLAREEYGSAERALEKTKPGTRLVLWQPNRESFPVSRAFPLLRAGRIDGPNGGESIGKEPSSEKPSSREEGKKRQGPSLSEDYSGIIDSSLGLLYHYSMGFSGSSKKSSHGASKKSGRGGEPLYVTGGPTESREILRRIAGMWDREVATIGKVGAALGAAAAGVETLKNAGYSLETEGIIRSLLPIEKRYEPEPAYLSAYHGEGGYLRRLTDLFTGQAMEK